MSGYQDYLDALEVLGSAAERAARARDQAGDYGRDDLRHAAMDRREHEQEWDRILTETTHLSRSAQTLARSHGLPVAEAAEAPGATTGPGTEATPTREAADAEATSDMMPVVVELSLARDSALNEGDAVALASTTVPGSPAALADEALLAAIIDSGEQIEGLSTTVHSVTGVPVGREAAESWTGATAVRVSQSQAPSARIAADGSRREVPAQARREVVLVLVPDPWRVAEVLQAD